MAHIDAKIADDEREYRLGPYRPRLDPVTGLRNGSSSAGVDGAQRDDQRTIKYRRVNQAGHGVDGPPTSEDRLLRVRRGEPLEWNEDQGCNEHCLDRLKQQRRKHRWSGANSAPCNQPRVA
jgi:hypothetical protein